MIDSIPHDQIFTQLVINQLMTYYDKCCGWYKALVTRLASNSNNQLALKAAASYAQSGEIHDIVIELLESKNGKNRVELVDKEISALIGATTATPLEAYDIISDAKSVAALSLLQNSMQWLASSVGRLRQITSSTNDSRSRRHSQSRRWTLISSLNRPAQRNSMNPPIHLPMTSESVTAFDNTLQSLRDLATQALLTLHIDIRCGVIHMLSKALRGPNNAPLNPTRDSASLPPLSSYHHILSSPPQSASQAILDLNTDLISFDTNTSTYLGSKERHFIIAGLGRLIDRVFVSSASLIGVMNNYGAQRLCLDVLVLQQNLRNLDVVSSPESGDDVININVDNTSFDEDEDGNAAVLHRSAKFFDLFLQGPEKVLEYAQEQKNAGPSGGEKLFSYDELKVLVELCFSEGLRSENREDAVRAKKGEGDLGLRLQEIMWDS